MDLLQAYDSSHSEGEDDGTSDGVPTTSSIVVANSAPDVAVPKGYVDVCKVTDKVVMFNQRVQAMYAPAPGPTRPFDRPNLDWDNVATGRAEELGMEQDAFERQYHSFVGQGFAFDPDSQDRVVAKSTEAMQRGTAAKRSGRTAKTSTKQLKRKPRGDPTAGTYLGPWAPYVSEDAAATVEGEDEEASGELDAARAKLMAARQARQAERKRQRYRTPARDAVEGTMDEVEAAREAAASFEPSTTFHGKEERDYLGRTFIHPPSTLKPKEHDCYIPKRIVHTWNAHSKPVNAIRFFPKYGHLLLSAGADGLVKIWDVYNRRQLLRTYNGHTKSVRNVTFNNDGSRFLSCGFDRNVQLWDTETGAVIRTFTNKKLTYCVKFHPENQNEFIVGCGDRKVYQWDCNSGETVQEYDRHLGAVNSVTFVDKGRRFVSTSDDKTIRVWEYGIAVDFKIISDPSMHSMPCVSAHPNGKWLALQSMDNTINICDSRKFRMDKKKQFKGHMVAGWSCDLDFASDGRFIVSGDSRGFLYFWDWRTKKLFRKHAGHDGVCQTVRWHPAVASRVASGGHDGKIKLWD